MIMNQRVNISVLLGMLLLVSSLGLRAQSTESYPIHPDSRVKEGVPQGRIEGPIHWESNVFPGTVRNYWLYIPEQYNAQKPACVAIIQDGLNRAKGWKLPTIFDNLIHSGEMPVTIGIFISPGVVPAPNENAQPRFNRSYEYDALGDQYARFLLEEILPEVSKSYNLSNDPNDRLIGGASSGAICAFNAAWERPDAFRRVLSTIGTYVGLRGGNAFPMLVRKTEPKPIRVFLQDGNSDLNIYPGSWWVANQDMLSSLQWAGYDVKHIWGQGGHNGKHSTAIMPEAIRWLWRDYPNPITPGITPERRTQLLIPGEEWELVSEGHGFTEGPAVNAAGEVFFTDIPNSKIWKIGLDGHVTLFAENTGRANGLVFGAEGQLFACASGKREITAYSPGGTAQSIIQNVTSNDLVCRTSDGYFTDPNNKRVYYVDAALNTRVVDTGIEFPNGLALSPDQTLLYVADMRGQFTYSFQIQADGSLAYKQPFFHLHVGFGQKQTSADGMTVDTEGRLYIATDLGVQVCDQPGRVHLIVKKPQDAWLANVVFGGKNRDTLYATCADKVFKRRLNAQGLFPAEGPSKPPRPRL
jgi:gluconolactonase